MEILLYLSIASRNSHASCGSTMQRPMWYTQESRVSNTHSSPRLFDRRYSYFHGTMGEMQSKISSHVVNNFIFSMYSMSEFQVFKIKLLILLCNSSIDEINWVTYFAKRIHSLVKIT